MPRHPIARHLDTIRTQLREIERDAGMITGDAWYYGQRIRTASRALASGVADVERELRRMSDRPAG